LGSKALFKTLNRPDHPAETGRGACFVIWENRWIQPR